MEKLPKEGNFKPRFLVMPDFVFSNKRLTFMSVKVYALIYNFPMENFRNIHGNERMAEILDCSESDIEKAINQLEREALI